MNKEYFTENISKETLTKLIDETLNYEKTKRGEPMRISNLLKIAVPVAVLVLIFGLINIIPMLNFSDDIDVPDNSIPSSENIYANSNINQENLFLPEIIEKSFFENKILAAITDKKSKERMLAYFALKDPADSDLTDRNRKEMIVTYPICQTIPIYAIDPDISKREKDRLLEYIREYTNITRSELIQMCVDIDYMPMELDDRYANVRFGDNYNTLLLDVEWHTYDTYLADLEEFKTKYQDNPQYEEIIKSMEKNADKIKEKSLYKSRSVNGKFGDVGNIGVGNTDHTPLDISQYLDSDGYYIVEIYPYYPYIYYDENGIFQRKNFDMASSKDEYLNILNQQIIPFCDDLLGRGLLTQEDYDYYTTLDPLNVYVDAYFN